MGSLRLLIVDDEHLVRSGLRLLLDGAGDIEVVGEAVDGEDAVQQAERLTPDVILMDIRMPRLDGITAAARIRSRDPEATIVMLTTFDADAEVLTALEKGATGFLLKDTPPADLVAAVHSAAAGTMTLSPSVTRQVVDAATSGRDTVARRDARARLAVLTPREREVAEAVAAGTSNADIAAQLFVSLATVKTHVARIMTKIGAENRVQIAVCVHDAGGPAAADSSDGAL